MSSLKNHKIVRDIPKQMYRSKKSYQEQMRSNTEREADMIKLDKESEFVKPYKSDSYDDMEYNFQLPDYGGPGDPPYFDIEGPPRPDYPPPTPPPNPDYPNPDYQDPEYPTPNPQYPNYPVPQPPPGPGGWYPDGSPSPGGSYSPSPSPVPFPGGPGGGDYIFFCGVSPCFCAGETKTFQSKCTYEIVSVTFTWSPPAGISVSGSKQTISITAASDVDEGASFNIDINMRAPKNSGKGFVYGTHYNILVKGCRPDSACDPCIICLAETPVITYTTQQMAVNETQELGIADYGTIPATCFTWELDDPAHGSLSDLVGYTTIYTAPAANAECVNNPTISLLCNDVVVSTLQIAVNANASTAVAFAKCWKCVDDYSGFPYRVTQWRCSGARREWDYCGWSDVFCSQCPDGGSWYWDHFCCKSYSSTCVALGYSGDNAYRDYRTAAMITAGCCPEQDLL